MEELIKTAQNKIDYESANDPTIRKILKVVKEFLQQKKVLCYGGTAINNLLEEKHRFYDPNYDIPDYDFYSQTPQEHALQLADRFYSLGFRSIEVKPGNHLMTFKVFVNYTGVADITYLESSIFEKLWKEDIVRDKIHYVSPNFLRMSMYLELSRPRGDVSRWSKVYKRLLLLNKTFPIECKEHGEEGYSTMSDVQREKLEAILIKEGIVLLGTHAVDFHSKKRSNVWKTPVDVLVIPEKFEEAVKKIQDVFKGTAVEFKPYAELLPKHTDILVDNRLAVRLFEATACHSYHKLSSGLFVGSIPTLLQFFFAFVYADSHMMEGFDENRIICICQRLVDLASSTSRRFEILTPLDCIGHQESLIEMKKHKGELYEKLPKNSLEFLKFFFSYKPGSATKTQKHKLKENLRKTMKSSVNVELTTDTD